MFVYSGDYQYYGYHPQAGPYHYSHLHHLQHLHHHHQPPPPPACCQFYNYNYHGQPAISHRASIASVRALSQGQYAVILLSKIQTKTSQKVS